MLKSNVVFIKFLIFFQSIKQRHKNSQKMKYESMKQVIFLKGTQRKILDLLETKETIQFIDFVDQKNNTPLHYAVSLNYKIAIKKYLQLLKKQYLWQQKLGISNIKMQVIIYKTKTWINAQNNDGLTAMHYASLKGDIQIAELLQNAGARFDKITKSGLNVYTLAAQQGKFQSLVFLRGKIDINAKDARGCTALHWSCYKGHQSIVKYLISQNNIQIDFKDTEGRTALHIATIYQYPKIVQILLLAGANRFIKDKNNKLAQDYAGQNNSQKIYKILTERQKSICSCCENRCGNAKFYYMPKKKQDCKWLILIFLTLLLIIGANFILNRTPLHFQLSQQQTSISLSDHDFLYGWIFFGFSLLINLLGFLFALHIHYKRKQNDQFSPQYIKENIQLLQDYCFQCNLIQQQGTKHCNICHECVCIKITHSNVLGRCIGLDNRYRYLLFLIFVTLVLLLQIVCGASQLAYILNSQQIKPSQKILKIIITTVDLLCILPTLYLLTNIIKTIRILCRLKQFAISRKLSQTTLDSNSTLVAQKLKKLKLDESIRKQKSSKGKKTKNIVNTGNHRQQRISIEEVLIED